MKFVALTFCSLFILAPYLVVQASVVYASTLLAKMKSVDAILDVESLPRSYSRLIIDVKCELAGKCLSLPMEADLVFVEGGYLDKGEIRGNSSRLLVQKSAVAIGLDILISGVWNNDIVYDSWFDFNKLSSFVSNDVIDNILSLTTDDQFCHIYFIADRTYYIELPYKNDTYIGDRLSYSVVNKKKKRNYSEIYKNEHSYLRIFTIPSNTHLTIRNHFQLLPTNQGAYFVFWEYKKCNIIIDGDGIISGDAKWHIYNSPFVEGSNYYGEWGHVFCCIACSDFSFRNITIQNSFGDCIVYTADHFNENVENRFSQNLFVDSVKIRYARRNGITIGAKNVVIQNSLFEGCGIDSIRGVAPQAGIDFESDGIRKYLDVGNENIHMKKCEFRNNKHDLSSTFNNLPEYGKVATYISDCEFTAPLRLNTTNWIEFRNCIISDITNFQDKITDRCPVRHIRFRECVIKKMPIILLTPSWDNLFLQTKILKKY